MAKVCRFPVLSAMQVMSATKVRTQVALQMARPGRNALKVHSVRQGLTSSSLAPLANTVRVKVRQTIRTVRSAMRVTTVLKRG